MDLETVREKHELFHATMEPDLQQEKKSNTNCHINKEMVRYKLNFFLLSGGLGVIAPFLPAFVQKHLKLSATAFGTVVMVSSFCQPLSKPIIGFIVDYLNKLKAVICILIIFLIPIYFAFFSLPTIPSDTSNNFPIQERYNSSYSSSVCYICKVLEGSEIETNDWIKQREAISNLSDGNELEKSNNLCKLDLNNKIYNLSYIPSCFFNRSGLELIDHGPPVVHIENGIFLNIPGSGCFCEYDLENSIYNFSYFLSLCNESGMSLSDHKITGTHNRSAIFINVNSSRCSKCRNETNLCSFHTHDCILCCINFTCYENSNNVSKSNSSSIMTESHISSYLNSQQFWLFAFLFLSMHICIRNMYILYETACCEIVNKNGADYGKLRMFGAIGWGLMSLVGGFLSDYTQNYMAACSLFTVMWILMLIIISKMDFSKPNFSTTFFKDVGGNFTSKEFIVFEIGVLVNGMGLGAIYFYLVWFLTLIGGSNLLFGVVHTIKNISCIPFMFFSGLVLKKMGYFHVTTLSLLSYCAVFLYLSYLQNPWYVLLMEWTYGIYFGLYCVTLNSFAKSAAKSGTEATMQAILFTTFQGFGSAIGNVVTGISIDYFGAHQTFYYLGIFFGLSSVISFIFTLYHENTITVCRRTSNICNQQINNI